MSFVSRKLSLHASALSDSEYQFYTTSLAAIVSVEDDGGVSQSHEMDDAYYENMTINVRETRAWLRGRYSHIPSSIIDQILKIFSQNLSATDCLSGGEFFAVLRLVVHAENGKEVDRSLAFVQAQLGGSLNSVPPRTDQTIATSSSSSVIESSSYNPFAATPHSQPPLHPSQRSESSLTPSPNNPFVHRNLTPRSDSGNAKLPPLPPRKQVAPLIPSPMSVPSKNIISSRNRLERSRSPSKPASSLLSLHPPVPPKPIHHVTSTLIKQSLQATKAAQTMKKAEEQLEKERVMQVLKSSSTVSGTHVYNQHQYHQQQRRSPSPIGATGGGLNKKPVYAASLTSTSSDERAPPLPRRRTQQQPSPPLSASSFEQVALATTHIHSTSAPPSSSATAFSNPEVSSNAHVHAYPHPTSPFRPRSRVPVDSTLAVPYSSSPEQSPRQTSLELPGGGTTRGRPPPTHPDRKPHHLQHQSGPNQNSHGRSQSHSYSDPFAGNSLDLKDQDHTTNISESFETIYGPSIINNPSSFANPFPLSSHSIDINSSTSSPNRNVRSKSLHQLNPPAPPAPRSSLRHRRPGSVQVPPLSDIGIQVDRSETMRPSSPNRNSEINSNGRISRQASLKSTPSKLPQTLSSSSSSLTLPSLTGPTLPASPSASSTTTMTTTQDQSKPAPNPLVSLQKTLLQIQPHLDKARYKAEAGLSKRGFVRDGLRRGKSSGSIGIGEGGNGEENESEDGLEGLMNNGSEGGGKKQIGLGRWRVHSDGGGLDGEVDQESDWTRGEGMSMARGRGRVQDSDGDECSTEKDNLKWPAGEGWKPL